ncbi:Scr1 family TA system antitoxin-like transcriptional regulator [Lentzea sp. NPDC092896]|uniref:helix-turn-helix domain-containing protein n=1 Tax=Lentzea sp. NPDC092896 TaxID=3364127 RepID=UPI0038238B4E
MIRDDAIARKWLTGVELSNTRAEAIDGETGEPPSQQKLAKEMGVTRGLIGHWEQGRYFPQPDQIRQWYNLCTASLEAAERLIEFGRPDQSSTTSWLDRWKDVVPGDHFMRRYVGAEGIATHVFYYAQMFIPALLQEADYALAVTAPSARVEPGKANRLVDFRMFRQERVLNGSLGLTVVIEEDALDRPILDRDGMRKAWRRLLEFSEQDNVDVRILPREVGRHDGLEGRFQFASFCTPDGQVQAGPVAYIEVPNSALYVTTRAGVTQYTDSSTDLAAKALSDNAARKAIEERLAA